MSNKTRQTLLETALDIFAEEGFKSATVQQIADRAKANISAINYHFGNKANFYAEAVVHHMKNIMSHRPKETGYPKTPETELHEFISLRISCIAKEKPPKFIEKILIQEMANPGPVMDKMVEHVIRPNFQQLSDIMTKLLPEDCSESEIRRHCFSVIGQCNFYLHSQPIISRLFPDIEDDQNQTGQLAEHITSVCLAAVKAEHDKRK